MFAFLSKYRTEAISILAFAAGLSAYLQAPPFSFIVHALNPAAQAEIAKVVGTIATGASVILGYLSKSPLQKQPS